MNSTAKTPEEYLNSLPPERKSAVEKLRRVILNNLPEGFVEEMNYGMLGYVVPHSIYPQGYHCDPIQSLPFLNLASQKNYIALYHMGLYADKDLLEWFTEEHREITSKKPDMGKSCIRFKNLEKIPFTLIGKLVAKKSPQEWIVLYETQVKK